MRVPLLLLTFFIFTQTNLAQTEALISSESEANLPIRYFGHFEFNGLIPLKNAAVPNHLAFESKYWFSKAKTLKSSLGFGWQMGFNEGYAKRSTNYTIDALEGKELSYLYNYLSVRYKIQQSTKMVRPYAELGGGWLLVTDKFVDRPLNPDYEPNHTCPDGPDEYLRNTRLIRAQNRLVMDVELGFNFQVNDKVSLNLGVGGILTNPIANLEKGYQPIVIENGSNSTTQSYHFRKRALHSTSLKIGMALLLFKDPNVIRTSSNEDDCFLIDDFMDSGSCN